MIQKRIYNYFDCNSRLHVLFIFDSMGHISPELEGREWHENYIYKVFDGAWFNTKYNIEFTWKEKNVVLLFPAGICPNSEESMLRFPLLDMLKANMEYKEDDYATFMQQYQLPERFKVFVSKNVAELSSSKVNGILKDYLNREAFSEDVAVRAMISSYFDDKKLLEWDKIIVKMVILGQQSQEKKRTAFFKRVQNNVSVKNAIDSKLTSIFGFSYSENDLVKVKALAESIKYNSITQMLTESVHDNYKKYKIKKTIAIEQLNKIYDFGVSDKSLSDDFRSALEVLANGIQEQSIIDAYGIDAEYYNLTEALCWPILTEVLKNKLIADPEYTNDKMRSLGMKVPASSDMYRVIKYVEQLALYYTKIKDFSSFKFSKPDDYIQLYLNEFYLLDTFYRKSLAIYHELVTKDIPVIESLNEVKRKLDLDYAKICNVFNLEWLTCIKENGDNFDSVSLKKQENFFTENYDSSVKQVVIISDALRYEVALELMQELSKEKLMATITPYRAMLPTETKFCKPSLLPHNSLALVGTDMQVDGTTLNSIDQRTAHVSKYKDKSICINYDDLMNMDSAFQRELFKRPLVYIFHNTIDDAGHSQNPFEVISACTKSIEQLAVLFRKLHSSWNVSNVFLTSDHGFIYNDMKFEDKDKHSITDDTIEKKTRYYLTTSTEKIDGIVKFPLGKVSGMKSALPTYVAVPEGTNRLAAPGGYGFAHGGATLQEMIIPVIQSNSRRTEKTDKVNLTLLSFDLSMVSSRVKITIVQSEAISMTKIARKIIAAVYSNDEVVTKIEKLTLDSADANNLNNRLFEIALDLNKPTSSSILELRIYDEDDQLNPLIKAPVKNNTLIEQDF